MRHAPDRQCIAEGLGLGMRQNYIVDLKRVGRGVRRRLVSTASFGRMSWATREHVKSCNAKASELLQISNPPTMVEPLRDAFLAIYNDRSHPLNGTLTYGKKHWYDKSLGLNDIALDCGFAALCKRQYAAARLIATLIDMTGFDGPKTMKFLAAASAANGEWGAAEAYYKKSGLPVEELSPNSEDWLHRERQFHLIDGLLRELGVYWIDLNPARSTFQREQALDRWWMGLLRSGRIGLPEYGPALRAIAKLRQNGEGVGPKARVSAEVIKMGLENFRNYLAGKSICLVANSKLLLAHELGMHIDSYDLVMRFNSFIIDPVHTGVRTDIHAAVHLYEFNLNVPVEVRILVSGKRELWTNSVHAKIRPGMQKYLGDASLHWPAVQLGLIDGGGSIPTVGFNMLRTLDHLDVNPVIDLVGFDFYASGMHRLEDALPVPHSRAHNSEAEKEWVLSNAREVTKTVISMR